MKNKRKERRDRWWQYAEKCPALYRTIAGLDRVVVLSLVSNKVAFAIVQNRTVFAHKLAVFALNGLDDFAVLQSFFHYNWCWQYCSTMRTDLNYSPSDCFETFPFPDLSSHTPPTTLTEIGERYHTHRCRITMEHQEGLTKTYNRFHTPDETAEGIQKLRQLHVEMDNGVAAAYGWADLDLGHGFHETRQGVRFTISESARREVLARLLKLNHERYAEEVKQGLHEKGAAARSAKRRKAMADDELGNQTRFF